MKTKTRGYTLVELIMTISLLAVVSAFGLLIYAVIHFIAKFW